MNEYVALFEITHKSVAVLLLEKKGKDDDLGRYRGAILASENDLSSSEIEDIQILLMPMISKSREDPKCHRCDE
ncbi:MAG: hypothetical protein ABSB35_18915 [Bryobacteraceae bacterium]|jgi:hypothetical protein